MQSGLPRVRICLEKISILLYKANRTNMFVKASEKMPIDLLIQILPKDKGLRIMSNGYGGIFPTRVTRGVLAIYNIAPHGTMLNENFAVF